MIRPGEEWGTPTASGPDVVVTGGDGDLARAVERNPGRLFRFSATADSDLLRVVGTDAGAVAGLDVPVDALRLGATNLAVNMVVAGTPPDRLRRFSRRFFALVTVDGREVARGPVTTVVVATGEFLRGNDIVPRGHPGDGRAEIQAYAVGPGQRRALRTRLRAGAHVPHPAIAQATGKSVEISFERPVPVEVDGRPGPPVSTLSVTVIPAAYRLLL